MKITGESAEEREKFIRDILRGRTPAKKAVPEKQTVDVRAQFVSLIEQARTALDEWIASFEKTIEQLWNSRADTQSNPTGQISADIQNAAKQGMQNFDKIIQPLGTMMGMLSEFWTEPIDALDNYERYFELLRVDISSMREFIEKLNRPLDHDQARGVEDKAAAQIARQEFIQRYYPEGATSSTRWPVWLTEIWKREKPSERYTSPLILLGRIESTVNSILKLPVPNFGKSRSTSRTDIADMQRQQEIRIEQAENALGQKVGIPDNLQRAYEIMYPEGLRRLMDPRMPRVSRPHDQPSVEYDKPHQKPGYVPKSSPRHPS